MKLVTAAISATIAFFVLAAPSVAEVIGEEGGFIYVKREATLPKGPGTQTAESTARCPTGTARTGGGATVTGKLTGTAIATSGSATERQWYVEGWHTGINSKSEKLTSWVICTEQTGKVTDATKLQSVGAAPAGANATAECVQGHAVGGGARLIGNASDWWLNSIGGVDTGDADEAPDDGWVAWVEHPSGPPSSMITDVICMDGKQPTYRKRVKETDERRVTKKVFCPKGTSATGGGAFASGATSDSHITSTSPIDSKKDPDKVPDDGWKAQIYNDNQTDQDFTASVVCR